MKNLETYVEKIFREYMEYKNYLLEESKNIEEVQQKIVDESEGLDDKDLHRLYFDKVAWVMIAQSDLAELKARLYFTMEAYKDFIEPPKEIKEAIETELEGVGLDQVFAVKNGERTIINKTKYDLIEKTYFERISN